MLRAFLKEHAITLREAGSMLGLSHVAILSWLRRRATPRESVRDAIERWTGGAVPSASWLKRADAIELERLKAIGPCPRLADKAA